jgi:hypothetical protein
LFDDGIFMRAFAIALGLYVTALAVGMAQAQLADPRVTQDNLQSTICKRGYTRTVRPPVMVTGRIKHRMMQKAWITDPARNYELDHIIPLEAGGAPNNPKNFQIQSWHGVCNAHLKDALENLVHEKICSGEMTLAEGQAQFTPVEHWKQAYADLVDDGGCESADGQKASLE